MKIEWGYQELSTIQQVVTAGTFYGLQYLPTKLLDHETKKMQIAQ